MNHIHINYRELLINLLLFFPKRSVSVLLIKIFKLILSLLRSSSALLSSPLFGERSPREVEETSFFCSLSNSYTVSKTTKRTVLKSESSLFLQENKSAILF